MKLKCSVTVQLPARVLGQLESLLGRRNRCFDLGDNAFAWIDSDRDQSSRGPGRSGYFARVGLYGFHTRRGQLHTVDLWIEFSQADSKHPGNSLAVGPAVTAVQDTTWSSVETGKSSDLGLSELEHVADPFESKNWDCNGFGSVDRTFCVDGTCGHYAGLGKTDPVASQEVPKQKVTYPKLVLKDTIDRLSWTGGGFKRGSRGY